MTTERDGGEDKAAGAQKPKPIKAHLVIDTERCKGCGFCVEFCARHALELSPEFNKKGYHPPVAQDERCVACGTCELICPEFAIYPVKEAPAGSKPAKTSHLAHPLLRMDRMPHIWCPGCGIGTTVNCFAAALTRSGVALDKLAVVSGIGCTGRVAGYVNVDSFHTTHGRAIPFATGLALANPGLKVVVYSGDGDLTAIGGNHFIHAARRNVNLTVICVNNFIYGMTGGQVAPTTPEDARASTAPYGCYQTPFNLPFLAESSGAVYVARWTAGHVRSVITAMTEAIKKKGFSFVEVVSPCPTLYTRLNKLGDGLDMMKFFRQNSEVRNGADTRTLDIALKGKIAVGKFVDRESPPYLDRMNAQFGKVLGKAYVPWGEESEEHFEHTGMSQEHEDHG